jgi:hypothetical protein
MIWSIIPEEIVFSEETNDKPFRQVPYYGRQVLIRNHTNGKGEIISLLSTDPLDFLNAKFMLGTIISIK